MSAPIPAKEFGTDYEALGNGVLKLAICHRTNKMDLISRNLDYLRNLSKNRAIKIGRGIRKKDEILAIILYSLCIFLSFFSGSSLY